MKKQAILRTLHYADVFDYPLRAEEIKKFLTEPADATLEETLSQIGSGPYYCLPGREKIIELRKRREVYSRSKIKKAKRIASFLKFIPWIKLIGVTGALAMENSDEEDDIDLMIVTSSKRLWLTRGLVVTFLRLTGQYRRPGKIKDMICPNLMISEDALEFPDRDLFTAHEIAQMKPIFSRDNTYQKFLQANSWVFDLLPNVNRESLIVNRPQPFNHLTIQPFDLLETLAYKLQLKYMKKRKTIEVTTPSVIRFHPHDIRQWVLDDYQRRTNYN